MKTTNLFYAIVLITAITACSKSDENQPTLEIIEVNDPPATFNLIGVADGAVGVEINPTLSWEAAVDPEGSAVNYDLILDTQTTPSQVYASNITGTFFELKERLSLSTEYFWKVVAKDDKGNTTQSATHRFSIRDLNIPSSPVTATANFPTRSRHTTVVFDNKIWVIGGRHGNGYDFRNDIWYSVDGDGWVKATQAAPFTGREGHTSAVFDNKLWVIGGNDSHNWQNDVWHSTDGVNWNQFVRAPSFPPKVSHATAVYDNKLWLIGGSNFENDVWYSDDGVNWTEATPTAPFSGRIGHTATAFDNKLWVIGGSTQGGIKSDVWFSSDGVNWTEATPAAAFSARRNHSTTVFDNKLWVIGGYGSSGKNDIWYSADGVNWVEATPAAAFSATASLTTAVFDDKLWIIEGGGAVWAMD